MLRRRLRKAGSRHPGKRCASAADASSGVLSTQLLRFHLALICVTTPQRGSCDVTSAPACAGSIQSLQGAGRWSQASTFFSMGALGSGWPGQNSDVPCLQGTGWHVGVLYHICPNTASTTSPWVQSKLQLTCGGDTFLSLLGRPSTRDTGIVRTAYICPCKVTHLTASSISVCGVFSPGCLCPLPRPVP